MHRLFRQIAVDLLALMGLVTLAPSGRVVPRPVAARYTPDVTVTARPMEGPGPVQESLL